MRLRCQLFGCCTYDMPECFRCRAYVYDEDFLEHGILTPSLWRLKHWWWSVTRRCAVCHARMWWHHRYDEYTCSRECFDQWIPF